MVDDDGPRPSGPPVLRAHDPTWAGRADHQLRALRRALEPLVDDVDACSFEHIGSTAVPGLAAKPVVDLQLGVPEMPPREALEQALAPLGWEPARGSRPDSPGVTHDLPAPGDTEPDRVWRKRLFTTTDGTRPGILHVRLLASPSTGRTVAFRDRLRAEPALREAYERLKRALAADHAAAADYDDYTRGKTAFVRGAAGQPPDAPGPG